MSDEYLKELEDRIKFLEDHIDDLNGDISGLEEELTERSGENLNLSEKIAELEESVEKLENEAEETEEKEAEAADQVWDALCEFKWFSEKIDIGDDPEDIKAEILDLFTTKLKEFEGTGYVDLCPPCKKYTGQWLDDYIKGLI